MNDKYFHESPFAAKGFYNFETSAQLPRHRWYFFKEGFSPPLVKEAINSVAGSRNRELNILDPFCGCGTTPLTSSQLLHKCTGIEVNPFLAFISKVKTTPRKWRRSVYAANLLKIIRLSSIERISSLENYSTFSERDGLDKWLFNREVLRKFTSILHAIEEISPVYRNAFVLSAIVAAFDCSNVKRDGKALRYKKDWKLQRYSGNDVINKFRKQALMIIDDAETFAIQSLYRPRIINADSRIALSWIKDDSIDLVVTSPPYLNSFDYSDIYRPELFLCNYINNNKELTKLRLKTIRSHVQVAWPKKTSVESHLLIPIIQRLNNCKNLWNPRIPLMVRAYFDDLNKVIKKLSNKLRRRGEAWIVVSTSAYGGVHIPVDLIIAELGNDAGLRLEGIHRLRDLRTSGQQFRQLNTKLPPLRESLIILTKN